MKLFLLCVLLLSIACFMVCGQPTSAKPGSSSDPHGPHKHIHVRSLDMENPHGNEHAKNGPNPGCCG